MIRRLCCLVLALACGMQALALAQEPGVGIRVAAGKPLWAGQQVTLVVELMAPGYFDSAATFDLPDPAGVILMRPTERPVIGNRTVDGITYTTQQHELRAWPMRAGQQTIAPITVRFAYKANPLDTKSIAAAVSTQAVVLDVEQPPGTAGMGTLISARDLAVNEHWEPEPGSSPVEAGSAYTRTITFSAPDLPGMIFPPFPTAPIEGIRVYSKPRVEDHSDARGGFVGERRDTLTYVTAAPGQYTIPAVTFSWFDPDSGEVRSRDFAARSFAVIPNPAMASGTVSSAGEVSGRDTVAWALLALAGLALASLLAGRVRRSIGYWLGRISAPLRPLRLQPLNPGSGGDSVSSRKCL
ncbi:hypothetical protein [Haliea sp. E17]|uniref:hypothetical protein n=1 Tax=Haliea sp. E17 TaxID=3401576 RepID=UPI003AAEA342